MLENDQLDDQEMKDIARVACLEQTKPHDILMHMNRLEEKFDAVSAFVFILGQLVHERLAYRPIVAETLLKAIGTEQIGVNHILNCDAPEFRPLNTWAPLDAKEYGFNVHEASSVECENAGNIEKPKNMQSEKFANIQHAPEKTEDVKCVESVNVHGEDFADLWAEESENLPVEERMNVQGEASTNVLGKESGHMQGDVSMNEQNGQDAMPKWAEQLVQKLDETERKLDQHSTEACTKEGD